MHHAAANTQQLRNTQIGFPSKIPAAEYASNHIQQHENLSNSAWQPESMKIGESNPQLQNVATKHQDEESAQHYIN